MFVGEQQQLQLQRLQQREEKSGGDGSKGAREPLTAEHDFQDGKCLEHGGDPFNLFCNDCNELCCLKYETKGRHKGHNVLSLEEVKGTIKTSLEANVKGIENELPILQNALQGVLGEIDKNDSARGRAEEAVRKRFDEIRKALDEKEIEILKEIEETRLGEDELNHFISDTQKAIDELSSTLESGNSLLSAWDNVAITPSLTHKVISIADKAKRTSEIKNACNEFCKCIVAIESNAFEDEVKQVIQSISAVKRMDIKRVTLAGPKGLRTNVIGPFSVSLEWDWDEQDTGKYIIAMQEEGAVWDPNSSIECTENKITVHTLEPDTVYKFSVRANRGAALSGWSDAPEVKTKTVTVENITVALKEHYHSIKVCVKSLEQMRILTREADNQVKAGQFGAIEVILDTMKTHINNADVCRQGCGALCNIAINAENNIRAGQFGAIEVILDVMKENINNADACESGCSALWNITVNYDNQIKAGQSGAIEVILDAMKKHINNADICKKGCGVLTKITINADNQVKAGQSGAIEVILDVMKKHINNVDVCRNGCSALMNITYNDADNKVRAGQYGAIEVILDAMKTHTNNAGVCENGCGALWNITINANNQVKAGQYGSIEVILDAMKMHISNSDVCRNGCGALCNITVNDDNKVRAGFSGAIELILDVMKTHINNADVCRQGCGALKNITANDNNQVKAGQFGAIEAILGVMKQHINNADLCYFGCGTLWNITANADNKVRAGESGAIEVILDAMKENINDADVCKQGCGALKNITANVDNVKKLKKLNGGEVIKKVQERHPDLSDMTKTILERINKSKGLFGLFG